MKKGKIKIVLKKFRIMRKIFLILFLMILVGCSNQISESFVVVDNGEKIEIIVEVADTLEKRQKGLMNRKFLKDNEGMLFIFENNGYYGFWMKNMLIPLDIMFISENLEIKEIKHAEPCFNEPCKMYKPSEAIKYVLEVNRGFTVRNNVDIGDGIELNLLN